MQDGCSGDTATGTKSKSLAVGMIKGYLKAFAYGLCHCEARGNLLE
jgi:hypothetical protein